MFFTPRNTKSEKGMPIMSGFPGLQLNLNIDHVQLLGTLAMMGLSRRPGFKEEMEEFMGFIQRMQESAEIITSQMNTMQTELLKVRSKFEEMPSQKAKQQNIPKQQLPPYVNPWIQHLFRLLY